MRNVDGSRHICYWSIRFPLIGLVYLDDKEVDAIKAIHENKKEDLISLLNNGLDINKTFYLHSNSATQSISFLYYAIRLGRKGIVECMMNNGANVTTRELNAVNNVFIEYDNVKTTLLQNLLRDILNKSSPDSITTNTK